MSKSRLAALRKKDLQELASSFNLDPHGLKPDIEDRVLQYLRTHKHDLSAVEQLKQFYPSPRKRSPGSSSGNGGAASMGSMGSTVSEDEEAEDVGLPKVELASPPVKFKMEAAAMGAGVPAGAAAYLGERESTPTKSNASSTSPDAGRRASRRLSNKEPIEVEDGESTSVEDEDDEGDEDDDEGENDDDEEEDQEAADEEDEDEEKTPESEDQQQNASKWPHRVSQESVLAGARTVSASITSILASAHTRTVSTLTAAKNAAVTSTLAANRRVQTTLSSVFAVNLAAMLVELAVLLNALYSQAATVVHIQPNTSADGTPLLSASLVPVPLPVLLVQLLSSPALFWYPLASYLAFFVLGPLVVSYYINFRSVAHFEIDPELEAELDMDLEYTYYATPTDPLVYNVARVLLVYVIGDRHGELAGWVPGVEHAGEVVMGALGKLPYVSSAVGIVLALYTV